MGGLASGTGSEEGEAGVSVEGVEGEGSAGLDSAGLASAGFGSAGLGLGLGLLKIGLAIFSKFFISSLVYNYIE